MTTPLGNTISDSDVEFFQDQAMVTRARVVKLAYRLYVAESNSSNNDKNKLGIQKMIDTCIKELLFYFRIGVFPMEFKNIYFHNLAISIYDKILTSKYYDDRYNLKADVRGYLRKDEDFAWSKSL